MKVKITETDIKMYSFMVFIIIQVLKEISL